LPFERRKVGGSGHDIGPVVVVKETVWVLVHAARASVMTTGTRARNFTVVMLP
jgi:hypothetical protein